MIVTLGSWFDRLQAFEAARLVVLSELMGNVAIHHPLDWLEPSERPAEVAYSTAAWLAYRDRLAVRSQRDSDVWPALTTHYTLAASLPTYGNPLDASVQHKLNYAVANLSGIGADGLLELIPIYGPRHGIAEWHDRRRRRRDHQASAEK